MAGRSLRAQLNQIRSWVRQGRTDAWIAHQLDVPATELSDFRKRHGLSPEDDANGSEDLRDEIEAEIEAATLAAAEQAERDAEAAEDEEEDEDDDDAGRDDDSEDDDERGDDEDDSEDGERASKPRRRRRGGRGRGRARGPLQATFDHGERDGYGLWLEPSVKDNRVYSEHWAGHRAVEVTIETDRIVIKRSGDSSD